MELYFNHILLFFLPENFDYKWSRTSTQCQHQHQHPASIASHKILIWESGINILISLLLYFWYLTIFVFFSPQMNVFMEISVWFFMYEAVFHRFQINFNFSTYFVCTIGSFVPSSVHPPSIYFWHSLVRLVAPKWFSVNIWCRMFVSLFRH